MTPEQLHARLALGALVSEHRVDAWWREEISDRQWATIVATARTQRVVPLLALASRQGLVSLCDARREEVEELWLDSMRQCVHLEAGLVWLVDRLAEKGVELRCLKGPASAHLDHARPEARQFGDIDVLARGDDLPAVFGVLEAEGYERRFPEPRPGFDRRFAKSVSFSGDVEFDVHRTIAEGPIGHRIPVADLWGTARSFEIGSSTVRALDDANRFLHACLHAVLAPPPARLSTLTDIDAMLTSGFPANDGDRAALDERLVRWRVVSAVDGAIDELVRATEWPPTLEARWAAGTRPGVVDAVLLASHRHERSSWALRALLSAATLPTMSDRLAYVRSLAFPSSQYVHPRHRGPLARLTYMARQIGRPVRDLAG